MKIQYTSELNKTLNRFNKIRLYHVNGYVNILPIKYLKKNPHKYHQVQLNTDDHYNTIMMDIDEEDLLTEWNAVGLPTPSIQTLNKHNNKAHLVWLLNVPVSKKNRTAVKYYKDIVNSIKLLIGADPAYQNHQTKNFLNHELFRVTYNDVAYDLNDFRPFIIRDSKYNTIGQDGFTEWVRLECEKSRHLCLYHKLRYYGYGIARENYLEEKLQKFAELINEQFESPIKPKSIIKAVYNFCEENKYRFRKAAKNKPRVMKFKKIKDLSPQDYVKEVSSRQSKSAARTSSIKRHKTVARIKVALDALIRKKIKITYANLAKEARSSLSTVKRYSEIIKLFVHKSNGVIRSLRVIALGAEERSIYPLKCCFPLTITSLGRLVVKRQ